MEKCVHPHQKRKGRRARRQHCPTQEREVVAPLTDAVADKDKRVERLHDGHIHQQALHHRRHLRISRKHRRQHPAAHRKAPQERDAKAQGQGTEAIGNLAGAQHRPPAELLGHEHLCGDGERVYEEG